MPAHARKEILVPGDTGSATCRVDQALVLALARARSSLDSDAKGWARDVSADIAREVRTRARELDDELPATVRDFVERACA
jgi:hypothetical protein